MNNLYMVYIESRPRMAQLCLVNEQFVYGLYRVEAKNGLAVPPVRHDPARHKS
jgi:hypothetical protein